VKDAMIQPQPRPFGDLLRQHRILAGLTQEALAEQAGLSRRAISDLERGLNQTPQVATLDLLVQALQLSANEQAEFRAAARWGKLEHRPAQEPLTARRLLSTPPTPLFGRAEAVQVVATLLQRQDVRLLTLTGTAGIGKTRLALAVAAEVEAAFPDGAFFIPLAALVDPAMVLPSIAKTLGLREANTLPTLTVLASALRDQQALLVLDNFEQVKSAAPSLAALLEACPLMKLLITSREVLHLRAEHQFVVPPLPLPALSPGESSGPLDPAALAKNPAMQLFLHRVRAAQPDFQATPDTTITLARICQRLEGLPLALELAAPRLKLLSPQALLARLQGRLQMLTGGAQDLPERQRTMRATLTWSYELLTSAEQALFRRLAVFVGSWDLSAAEQVCQAAGALEVDVLEGLASLLDKSLLRKEPGGDGEPRFGMLLEAVL
jgi:predicted ATPase/DNA-binding XRE family transcriptional regulator